MPSYTVVFTVDLTEVNDLAHPPVNENQTSATLAATRSTWLPSDPLVGNDNYQVKHGDTITAYDDYAYYLKQKYVKTASNPYGVLTVVSEA